MPNIKSAKKRMALSQKWEQENRAVRARLRTAIRRVREAKDAESAGERFLAAASLLDRAARKRIFHPKKAARLKGQLQTRVNRLRAG
jgi:small subunit ribosomal protein S20